MDNKDTIVGFDVGTTKTCAVVANVTHDGDLEILGVGLVPSRGIRKGVVQDQEKAITSIREARIQAERASNVDIDSAFVTINGTHIRAILSNAVVAVADPNKGITVEDTENALDIAQRVEIPKGSRLVDVRVRDYIVDGQIGISDPVGMSGMRLEVNALLLTAGVPQLEDLYRAVNQAGIDVENIILKPIASAEAILGSDERERGVAVIDIGGGTTGVAVYRDDGLAHLRILPLGGDHIDSDLVYGIGVTKRQAQHLMIKFGGVNDEHRNSDDIIELAKDGGKRKDVLPLKILAEIIYPRMEEILLQVKQDLTEAGIFNGLKSGIVLTGGLAQMPGITDLATEITGYRARIGYPRDIQGLPEDIRNPMFSTAIGLVKLGHIELLDKLSAYHPNGVQNALESAGTLGKQVLKMFFR